MSDLTSPIMGNNLENAQFPIISCPEDDEIIKRTSIIMGNLPENE